MTRTVMTATRSDSVSGKWIVSEMDCRDLLLSFALRTTRSMARPSGRLVRTRTCTGSGSRHAKTSGHAKISVLSTVVGAGVGDIVGAADVGAVGATDGNGVVVAVVVNVVVRVALASLSTPPPHAQHATVADTPPIGA